MSMQPLPVMPQAPHSILRPGSFNTDSDATFAKLPEVVEKYNANIPLIEGAALSAQNALTASDAALAAANFKGEWSGLAGALAIPASASHAGKVWMLIESVADVTAHEPDVSPKWMDITAQRPLGIGGAVAASGSVVLTAASAGAQVVTPTGYGQSVTLPDATTLDKGASLYTLANAGVYPMLIKDSVGTLLGFIPSNGAVVCALGDASTAAGVWGLAGHSVAGVDARGHVPLAAGLISGANSASVKAVALDSNRTLLLFSQVTTHAVVYDASTQTFGTAVLVDNNGVTSGDFFAALHSVDVVFTTVQVGSAIRGRVLKIAGTTITVGTAATASGGSDNGATSYADPLHGAALLTVGTSMVLAFYDSTNGSNYAIAATVNVGAGTCAFGAKTSIGGTDGQGVVLQEVSAGVCLSTWVPSGSSVYVLPLGVAGNVITVGSGVSLVSDANTFYVRKLASGRFAYIVGSTTTGLWGHIVTVAGTNATTSSVHIHNGSVPSAFKATVHAIGNQLIVAAETSGLVCRIAVLTDNAGVAVVGAVAPFTCTTSAAAYLAHVDSTGLTVAWLVAPTTLQLCRITISGNNPSIQCIGAYASVADSPIVSSIPVRAGTKPHGGWVMGAKFQGAVASAVSQPPLFSSGDVLLQRPALLADTNACGLGEVPAVTWIVSGSRDTTNHFALIQRARIA